MNLLTTLTTFIEHFPHINPSMKDLEGVSAVSERTIRTAFQEFFGIPPQEFIELRRLHECRKLLKKKSIPLLTVASIAGEFGFWDFGRFSGRYQRIFGELPSETLNRSKAGDSPEA